MGGMGRGIECGHRDWEREIGDGGYGVVPGGKRHQVRALRLGEGDRSQRKATWSREERGHRVCTPRSREGDQSREGRRGRVEPGCGVWVPLRSEGLVRTQGEAQVHHRDWDRGIEWQGQWLETRERNRVGREAGNEREDLNNFKLRPETSWFFDRERAKPKKNSSPAQKQNGLYYETHNRTRTTWSLTRSLAQL